MRHWSFENTNLGIDFLEHVGYMFTVSQLVINSHPKNFKRVCQFHLSITNEKFRDVSVTTKYHTLRFDTVDNQIILRKPGDQNVKVLV